MEGQVFTVAKLHYIHGVVYFTALEGSTDLATLAEHSGETTKSGKAKHPMHRVRELVRFAVGIGLIRKIGKSGIEITELGRKYSQLRAEEKWSLSKQQKEILREHILSNPSASQTIHSIASLLGLVEGGYSGKALAQQYAVIIGKKDAWRSEVTSNDFTNFGLSYLRELGFIGRDNGGRFLTHGLGQRTLPAHGRRTFLFTWNPRKWVWDYLPQAVYEANAEGRYLDRWSCGVTRYISPGDRAFLMRLGVAPKGIMGSGIIVSEPFPYAHWDAKKAEKGDIAYRVEILFDVLCDLPVLDERILASGELAEYNWFPQASGPHIPSNIAEHLESAWSRATGTYFRPPDSEDGSALRSEGTRRTKLVTAYERNSEAREECLKHHGTVCLVCGFEFEECYGCIGKGFIHVHHVVPVSAIGQEYQIDPIRDLCPVCPNCHAMLHKRTPPYTTLELQEMMNRFPTAGSRDRRRQRS